MKFTNDMYQEMMKAVDGYKGYINLGHDGFDGVTWAASGEIISAARYAEYELGKTRDEWANDMYTAISRWFADEFLEGDEWHIKVLSTALQRIKDDMHRHAVMVFEYKTPNYELTIEDAPTTFRAHFSDEEFEIFWDKDKRLAKQKELLGVA